MSPTSDIFGQLAAQDEAASKSGGDVFDQLAANGGSVPTAPVPQAPGSTTNYQAAPNGPTLAEREAKHPIITALGKGSQEFLGDAWDSIKSVPSAVLHSDPAVQVYDSIQHTIPVIQAYEDARQQGKGVLDSLSAANEVAKQQNAVHAMIKERAEEFKKQPGVATVRALGDAAMIAATLYRGGPGLKVPEAAAETSEAATPAAAAPAAAEQPSLMQQLIKGKDVAQPGAKAAVGEAVSTSAKAAGTEAPEAAGLRDLVQQHVDNLKAAKTAAYEKADQVAGEALGQDKLDLKALKKQVQTDTYNLQQLPPSETDKAASLVQRINENQDVIDKATKALEDAGVDPKAADVLNIRWQRGQQFQRLITKATNPDGSVDVDGLYKGVRNMRAEVVKGKTVDGLAQLVGKEGADTLEKQLFQMQKLGAHAVKARALAKTLGGVLLGGTAAGAVTHYIF